MGNIYGSGIGKYQSVLDKVYKNLGQLYPVCLNKAWHLVHTAKIHFNFFFSGRGEKHLADFFHQFGKIHHRFINLIASCLYFCHG